ALLARADALTEEKVELLEDIVTDGIEAEDALKKDNLLLVYFVAAHFHRGNFLENISHGTLGLTRAVKKFDPALGVLFSNYAVLRIVQFIQRENDRELAAQMGGGIGYHQLHKIFAVKSTQSDLFQQLGRTPTSAEVAREMTVKKLRNKLSHEPT